MLEDREAFLRAIFDNPDDDTPRLVYADRLDDHGDAAFAELIRWQCRSDPPADPSGETFRSYVALTERFTGHRFDGSGMVRGMDDCGGELIRGFLRCQTIRVSAADLSDPTAFRQYAATDRPHWFGATQLKIADGLVVGGAAFETIFNSPATLKVTALNLTGSVEDLPGGGDPDEIDLSLSREQYAMRRAEYRYRPVVTVLGVEALCQHRSARRLTELLLTRNNLDNDAARLLVRSPYLTRLKRLDINEGNDLRGDTWADLLQRFGEDVVS